MDPNAPPGPQDARVAPAEFEIRAEKSPGVTPGGFLVRLPVSAGLTTLRKHLYPPSDRLRSDGLREWLIYPLEPYFMG